MNEPKRSFASPAFAQTRNGFASDREVPLRIAQEGDARPSVPERKRTASDNLRRHFLRASFRVGVLLLVDLGAFTIVRAVFKLFREEPVLGTAVSGVISTHLPKGYLGGWEFGAALLIGLIVTGNYASGDRRRDVGRLFLACSLATALPLWTTLWEAPLLVASQYLITLLLLTLVLLCARVLLDTFVRRVAPLRKTAARAVLVGPGGDCIEMLGRSVFSDEKEFHVVGFVDTNNPSYVDGSGYLAHLDHVLHEKHVDTVVLCGYCKESTFSQVVKAAMAAECQVVAVGRTFELAGVHPMVVWRRGQPFIELRAAALRGQQLVLKRALDMVVSGLALFVSSPLLLGLSVAVRLDSPGPAVFGQRRMGRHGRTFRCFKFRSMHANAEELLRVDAKLFAEYIRNDYKLPAESDPRITRVGRFLRRTSLDELPQLWNVFRGDMSLVGPRPIVPEELHHYGHEEPLFLSLKPGVTGAWQVNGRSSVAYPERASVELDYVQAWSLAKDLEILLRTVPAVLSQRGAH